MSELRKGFTTGSCSAAATFAAAMLLLMDKRLKTANITLPKGGSITIDIASWNSDDISAECSVKKDSGDDPDVTNGILVLARVTKIHTGFEIDGGIGIGRVTLKGLNQPVGSAAINSVPRLMIKDAMQSAAMLAGYTGGLKTIISIPNGEKIAKKTFNPRLGIVGGLSILGTSGIVEPMSQQALLESIRLEINMRAANGTKYLALALGNYGQEFLQDTLSVDIGQAVKIGNFVGASIKAAEDAQINGILLVGHIGKLIKLAGGITQTHSMYADCRMEILAAHSALAGAHKADISDIMNAPTTEAALEILDKLGLLEKVMPTVFDKIIKTIARLIDNDMEFAVIVFSSTLGIIAKSENACHMAQNIKNTDD